MLNVCDVTHVYSDCSLHSSTIMNAAHYRIDPHVLSLKKYVWYAKKILSMKK